MSQITDYQTPDFMKVCDMFLADWPAKAEGKPAKEYLIQCALNWYFKNVPGNVQLYARQFLDNHINLDVLDQFDDTLSAIEYVTLARAIAVYRFRDDHPLRQLPYRKIIMGSWRTDMLVLLLSGQKTGSVAAEVHGRARWYSDKYQSSYSRLIDWMNRIGCGVIRKPGPRGGEHNAVYFIDATMREVFPPDDRTLDAVKRVIENCEYYKCTRTALAYASSNQQCSFASPRVKRLSVHGILLRSIVDTIHSGRTDWYNMKSVNWSTTEAPPRPWWFDFDADTMRAYFRLLYAVTVAGDAGLQAINLCPDPFRVLRRLALLAQGRIVLEQQKQRLLS